MMRRSSSMSTTGSFRQRRNNSSRLSVDRAVLQDSTSGAVVLVPVSFTDLFNGKFAEISVDSGKVASSSMEAADRRRVNCAVVISSTSEVLLFGSLVPTAMPDEEEDAGDAGDAGGTGGTGEVADAGAGDAERADPADDAGDAGDAGGVSRV